jgi:hypothetical protein
MWHQYTYIPHFTPPPLNVSIVEGKIPVARHATHNDGWWKVFKLKVNKNYWMLLRFCDKNNVPLHSRIIPTEKNFFQDLENADKQIIIATKASRR